MRTMLAIPALLFVAACAHVDYIGETYEPTRQVDVFFADAHTHTSAAGAEFNAAVVIAGLRALPQNPLAPYLRETTGASPRQP